MLTGIPTPRTSTAKFDNAMPIEISAEVKNQGRFKTKQCLKVLNK